MLNEVFFGLQLFLQQFLTLTDLLKQYLPRVPLKFSHSSWKGVVFYIVGAVLIRETTYYSFPSTLRNKVVVGDYSNQVLRLFCFRLLSDNLCELIGLLLYLFLILLQLL